MGINTIDRDQLGAANVDRIVIFTRPDEVVDYKHASLHTAICSKCRLGTKICSDVGGNQYHFEAVTPKDGTAVSPHNSALMHLDPVCYQDMVNLLFQLMDKHQDSHAKVE